MIERMMDESNFKVLEPRIYVVDDGTLFPFLHSTPIFPEWPLAALPHVPRDVAEEVQAALMRFDKYKSVGAKIRNCRADLCVDGSCTSGEEEFCDTAPPNLFDHNCPCETTRDLAELAYIAGVAGSHNGFRSPRSYFSLRTMQEAAGFMMENGKGE